MDFVTPVTNLGEKSEALLIVQSFSHMQVRDCGVDGRESKSILFINHSDLE